MLPRVNIGDQEGAPRDHIWRAVVLGDCLCDNIPYTQPHGQRSVPYVGFRILVAAGAQQEKKVPGIEGTWEK
jgi:hypothetical protein